MTSTSRTASDRLDFDAVVVGSGAGGAPIACKLAEAGAQVLLVERGRALTRAECSDRDELHWCRRDGFVPSPKTDPHTWRASASESGERTSDGWVSTVLGGGTVHMASYLLRADPLDALQGSRCAHENGSRALDWAVPFDDIARFYNESERDFAVTTSIDAHSFASTMDEAARAIGTTSIATPRGILLAARDDEDRGACVKCGRCSSYGCPTDARASTANVHVRRALKTGNLTVWTESQAARVVRDGANPRRAAGVVVLCEGREVDVRANVVVVACGAIESARLLLLSSIDGRGQVGRNLWFSLCAELAGFFDARAAAARGVDVMRGSPFLNRTIHVHGHLDEAVRGKTGLDRTGMFEASFAHDNPIKRAERIALTSTAARANGGTLWGRALQRELARQFRDGRSVVLEGFAEALPHDGSFVDLDPHVRDAHGLPVARVTHAHHERDARICAVQVDEGRALLREMGAAEDDIVVTRSPSETLVIQGGTCRFGDDASTSVTDREGRVHGFDNLFVPDGGALPSSLCAPATLTMVANALRIAPFVVARARR